MSRCGDIDRHLSALDEIVEVMRALKNLSLMEIRKLSRFLETQHRVMDSTESAAADFESFYLFSSAEEQVQFQDIYVLIGSERGFCGDFNGDLWKAMEERRREAASPPLLIGVGYKLISRFSEGENLAASLDGASVAEEIEAVLARLLEALNGLQDRHAAARPLRLTVFHHAMDEYRDRVEISVFDPFRRNRHRTERFAFPPLLNLPPRYFLTCLAEFYLFAGLNGVFYDSLMAENQRRLHQLEGAIRRMEEETGQLRLKRNLLRQEEITEEIELILLSVRELFDRM